MPPAKSRPAQEDSRSDASTAKDRQNGTAAHVKGKKNGVSALQGSSLKELALVHTDSGNVVTPGQSTGMAWNTADTKLLNNYRVSHHLSNPAAFTSPYHQALLTNPGLGRQSPTMARRREKRRISKEQLALAVRKNFNSAAVSEIDSIVEFVYKVRHQSKYCKPDLLSEHGVLASGQLTEATDKAFRMRCLPSVARKS
ncbi:hypothetical protein BAUCODRAFT_36950 [Baudoinia panamericana UAMH 10762]|uniref:Histone deacetylase complex subunit SAP30 Sin3 binding domain-containing protein n=1 Tax=Baudoinia panamericana (strain UAMH 10762) TaxID=717646 RepID=M2N3G7_BAUPA|nr:uncharacterized protein BAUCODRAFT_36950 [Baudoinia panamericana UAMH 10762]EMC93275.1 hypothetical protein BAUCODRAFT_36950 [Baudoinia panamericana UAMH 10762]